jgi:glycosyltransferase involved in cell wall biosynthesis
MVNEEVNASLVSASDAEGMAQACLQLLSDRALWQQRAQAGLLEAQRYTWASVQPVLIDVYQRAMAQQSH